MDPRKPETVDELLDSLPTHLLELYEWCEMHDIVTVNSLSEAPEHIRSVAMDLENRAKVLKLLYWRRATQNQRHGQAPQIYADEEEQQAMKQCHNRSLDVLKKLLGAITHRSLFRALDVAGGDGRLS